MKNPFVLSAAIFLTLGAASFSDAAITLVIEEFTNTTLTFSISGTLASNSGSGQPTDPSGIFALGIGRIALDFRNPSVPVSISGSITSSLSPNPQVLSMNGARSFSFFSGDAITMIPAGTSYSGRVTLTGDFYASAFREEDFQLWSGFSSSTGIYTVRHATGQAIPEPSATAVGGLALLGLLRRRR